MSVCVCVYVGVGVRVCGCVGVWSSGPLDEGSIHKFPGIVRLLARVVKYAESPVASCVEPQHQDFSCFHQRGLYSHLWGLLLGLHVGGSSCGPPGMLNGYVTTY